MKNSILRIAVGLTFYVAFGLLVFGLWLGPSLLGYEGEIAADMAFSALPVLAILWLLCFPFLVLSGALIEGIGLMIGLLQETYDLR